MQRKLNLNITRLLMAAALFLTFNAYAGCNVEQVKKADQAWATAMSSLKPAEVVKLYGNHAVLLATFQKNPIHTPAQLHEYFTTLLSQFQSLTIKYDSNIVQLLPGGAVSSGLYTFQTVKDGKETDVPARYTFVYKATPAGCMLINHHSSVLPQ